MDKPGYQVVISGVVHAVDDLSTDQLRIELVKTMDYIEKMESVMEAFERLMTAYRSGKPAPLTPSDERDALASRVDTLSDTVYEQQRKIDDLSNLLRDVETKRGPDTIEGENQS